MKVTLVKLVSIVTLLALALSGCKSQSRTSPTPESQTAAVPAAAQTEPAAEPTPSLAPEELPMGFTDLLDQKIASGDWTREEGLVTILKLFAGEISAGGNPLGSGVQVGEGTGIIQLANEYLESGPDAAARDEIARLLKVIVPTRAMLDPYTIPEGSSRRGLGLAAPVRQTSQDCAALWAGGFPDTRTPAFTCFLSGTRSIGGYDYSVYYPQAWHGDGSKDAYYAAMLEAIQDTVPVYQTFGSLKSIYFVFTTLSDPTNPTDTLAVTHLLDNDTEACPVIFYPASLALSIPNFKQTVAHEMFHCFQTWNLREQLITAGYASADWWVEGSAEYFSNVVYPATDYEHRFAYSFSQKSTAKPLTDMSYENFAFIQFIADKAGGPSGVLNLLKVMPTESGTDKQLAALAAYPNIDALFEQFAQEVIDLMLLDTSGDAIDIPENFSRMDLISGTFSSTYTADPFILQRFELSFDPQYRYTTQSAASGAAGRAAAREAEDFGNWAPMPAEFNAGCQPGTYILYVLNTEPGKQYTYTLNTTQAGDAPCDVCLVGGWEATAESYKSYMQSVMSQTGNVTIDSVSGKATATFRDNGIGSAEYQDFVVQYSADSSDINDNPIPMTYLLTFTGYGHGPWTADGSALSFNASEGNITSAIKVFINGEPLDLGETGNLLPNMPAAPIGSGQYTCADNTFTYWPPVSGFTVSPIIFKKVW